LPLLTPFSWLAAPFRPELPPVAISHQ
jgi:hypothetical protein